MATAVMLSIIVPVLDEAEEITHHLRDLSALRAQGHEVIVVDGGSQDATLALCQGLADQVISAPRGRARQMNAGAALARGEVLMFLHADTRLPVDALPALQACMAGGANWGRFDVVIEGRAALLPVVSTLMNWRSRWTGVATGDQAIFVRRRLFEALGGYLDQPMMEDIELSRRLMRSGPPACLRQRVRTSGRRWEQRGVWRTVLLMWHLRWRYWRGTSAEELARAYR